MIWEDVRGQFEEVKLIKTFTKDEKIWDKFYFIPYYNLVIC
jgi:hypothetical protein